ncbi:MAG: radical SAM protein [Candidatus Nanohaloarchaea archaeon]
MPNLLLTEECNKNCPFCFAGPSSGKNPEHREKIDLADVARFARWCRDNNVDSVGILGGEPLTYHSFNEVLRIFDRNGVGVQLISNFTFPGHDRDLNYRNIRSYLLNTAALQSEADLKRFKENLERLTPENRRKVSVGYTIAGEDEDFSDLEEIASEYNIKNIRVDFATPSIDEESPEDALGREGKRKKLKKVFKLARGDDVGVSFDCNLQTQVKILFSEEERKKFIEDERIGFERRKETCSAILDVDVDLSAFHCFPLRDHSIDNILNYSLNEARAHLNGKAEHLRKGEQKHCLAFNKKD